MHVGGRWIHDEGNIDNLKAFPFHHHYYFLFPNIDSISHQKEENQLNNKRRKVQLETSKLQDVRLTIIMDGSLDSKQ